MRMDVMRFAELADLAAEPAGPSLPWDRSREACAADYREFIDQFGPGEVRSVAMGRRIAGWSDLPCLHVEDRR
ncbi:hypothetical protein [Kitasatospora sp. NPDC050463]|uniref:hypothetical protein n=1 Tax=Kitasatospora sp. NPDC050463 TaxID=3155786 RepID=UPI0033D571A6